MKKKIFVILSSALYTALSACFFAMNTFAEDAGSNQATGGNGFLTFVLPLLLMFVLLYFMAIRPQKKQEQEAKTMQESLQIGDEIVTNGGIVGMIVRIGDDNVVIETGGDRNKLRIKKWAITENVTANERAKQEQAKNKTPIKTSAVSEDENSSKKKKSGKSTEE